MLPAIPTPIPMPFAQNGERRAIPETNTVPGSADASWATGFPPVTRINKQAGGKPPYGLDFQGLFHTICEHLFFSQSGNTVPWVGASDGQPGLNYLKGAIVQGSDGETYMALKPSGPDAPNPDGAGFVGPVDPVGDTTGYWADLKNMFKADIATLTQAGIMKPDGVTATVDESGLLSALGGNLLLNDELWITESGTFEAPVKGWCEVLLIGGGNGAAGRKFTSAASRGLAFGGDSGDYKRHLVYLDAGQTVSVTIGAGGAASTQETDAVRFGGITFFGDLSTVLYDASDWRGIRGVELLTDSLNAIDLRASGGGLGGGARATNGNHATFYGGGGGAYVSSSSSTLGKGAQGAVCVRFWNRAKAAGPLPTPALFSARRLAPRAPAAPETVNLYDPETGQGSVWREEDAPAKLAEGMISEEAWLAICAEKAAEERAAWLASPETVEERFEMLRQACEARLAATDKLIQPDYPISEETRAELMAYRKALRELNHQPGAPWDGGGELTPWPEAPAVSKETGSE